MFGLAFVLALNIAARVDQPHYVVFEPGWETRRGPGGAMADRPPGTAVTPAVVLREAEEQLYQANLDRLRVWSLIAVAGLVLTSGIGGFVVSGFLLRPVRDITRVASEIGATNLSRRIKHEGADDELKELADTFDSMIGRLEQAFEGQRRFVQDASHELRTPLAAIRTNIEVTEMDADATLDDYRILMDQVRVQTERMARLSDDLLLLTSSEGDTPEIEPVNLREIGDEVVRQLAPLAGRRGVRLALGIPTDLEALGTPDLLYRCVTNLVDNAIKYSGDGASVTVSAAAQNGSVVLSVADTGPGIPAESLPHIFDRFYRVDRGRARREGGTGLGLAIVKELCEQMGGSVSVASTPGKGTDFTIRLSSSAGKRESPPRRMRPFHRSRSRAAESP